MMRAKRILLFVLLMALVTAALSGCSSVPDSVEDPLAAFDVDAMLPFATQAPELLSTATPAPTVMEDATPTPNPLDWQNEKLPGQEATEEPTPVPEKPVATQAPQKTQAGYYAVGYSDSGAAVWALQERLKKLGYYTGIIDGDFGSGTESAVKKFQRAIGLSETGVATETVQERIFADNAPTQKPAVTPTPTPAPTKTLKKGSSGSAVKKLQTRLKELGYYGGSADGEYGSSTVTAVKLFQKALGLEETGTATEAVQKRLYADSAPKYSSGSSSSESSGSTYKELEKGDSGSSVEKLQERLKELGYYTGSIDGEYGSGVEKAIKLFEKAYGKKQTGVASTGLQKYLFAKDAKKYEASVTPAPTEEKYKKLKNGDTGTAVKNLQRRLKELGYFDGDIGGNYLTKTTAAVKAFQKAIGAEQDGVATVDLQKKIFSSDAPSASGSSGSSESSSSSSSGTKELKKGDSGSAVKDLQTRLKDLGYYTGSIDGDYGSSTVDAVKLFEKAYGKKQSGVASTGLQKYLFAEDAKAYSGVTGEENSSGTDSDLKKGSSGQDVYRLQLRLIELGYLDDGEAEEASYDSATAAAVQAAQEASGYKKTDGVAYSEFVKWLYSDKGYSISLYEYGDGDVE